MFKHLADSFGVSTRPDPSVFTRRCFGCGNEFNSRDIQQRYCSPSCKQKHKPPRINYEAYLQSEDWQRKADSAKKRAGYRCQVCNAGTHQVLQLETHHRTYENLGDERTSDLTVLCNECHALFTKYGRLAKHADH